MGTTTCALRTVVGLDPLASCLATSYSLTRARNILDPWIGIARD